MTITIHCASTNRADQAFLKPLERAIEDDKRFLLTNWSGCQVSVYLGDRTELLGQVQADILKGRIIAHLAGGERSKGSTDDCVRDAMTKLAHLHYPFAEHAKKRILSLQEEEWRICVAGNPAVDDIHRTEKLWPANFVEKWPDVFPRPPKADDLMIAIHPVTAKPYETVQMIRFLRGLLRNHMGMVYISEPNPDPGSDDIRRFIKEMLVDQERGLLKCRIVALPNLGFLAFHSLMLICGNLIGNSSSLITEAPHIGALPVLIGTRQEGRLPDESTGDACKTILEHMFTTITARGDAIRIKQ